MQKRRTTAAVALAAFVVGVASWYFVGGSAPDDAGTARTASARPGSGVRALLRSVPTTDGGVRSSVDVSPGSSGVPPGAPREREEARGAGLLVEVTGPEGDGVDATLDVIDPRGGVSSTGTRTDTDGRAHIDGPIPAASSLRVRDYGQTYHPPLESPQQILYPANVASFDVPLDGLVRDGVARITLVRSAGVEGVVTGDLGEGLVGVQVCAHWTDGRRFKDYYAETGSTGRYRIACAPGSVRIQVHLGPDHELASRTRPRPRDRRLLAGEVAVEDFVLSSSGAAVRGRVRTPDGAPVGDLTIWCTHRPAESELAEGAAPYTLRDHAQSCRTSSDGSFVLEGLPDGRYSVAVGPFDYDPADGGRLGMHGPRTIALVEGGRDVDIGEQTVHLSHPFVVEGRLEIAEARHDRNLRLWAMLQPGPRRARATEKAIPLVRRDGRLVFRWSCETPEGPVLLELRDSAGAVAEEVVTPTPDGHTVVVLQPRPR